MLPPNLDADQARIVTLTLAAYTKLEQLRANPTGDQEEQYAAEERCLDTIREQMDELDGEDDFAELIRALVEAWQARTAHDELLAALKGLNEHARPTNWDDEDQPGEPGFVHANAWRAADAAIARAEGR